MDSAIVNPTGRKYPGYTLSELKAFIAADGGNPAMIEEVRRRESGESLTLHEIFQGLSSGAVNAIIDRLRLRG